MNYIENITHSGLTVYDPIQIGDPNLWIPSENLENILVSGLVGKNFGPLPLRTRSKVFNQEICRSLGYPVPTSFKKTKPRFVGQNFDKYVQKSNNMQIWNDEIDPERRYVLIRVDDVYCPRLRVELE